MMAAVRQCFAGAGWPGCWVALFYPNRKAVISKVSETSAQSALLGFNIVRFAVWTNIG